jgi:N-glycosylase/DNA lyase
MSTVFPEEYHSIWLERRDAIRMRLQEFRQIQPEDWFYEACFCILTPQSKAVHADVIVQELKQNNFLEKDFDPLPLLRRPETYIRFHNQKTKNLSLLRSNFAIIASTIHHSKENPFMLRDYLAQNIRGYGLKEAAHFMRNIGIWGPAILDRHILKHLHRCKVIDALPDSLGRSLYIKIEQGWLDYCLATHIPIQEMDLLFWSIETGQILK